MGGSEAIDFFFSKGLRVVGVGKENLGGLHTAAALGNVESIWSFLAHEVNPDTGFSPLAKDLGRPSKSPLHAAFECKQDDGGYILDAIEALLFAGADPNVLDCQGFSPLHLALQREKGEEVARVFASAARFGVNFGLKDESGWPMLHKAAFMGKASVLKVMLECGADPNMHSNLSVRYPLIAAIAGGSLECVKELLAAGANPNARDVDGEPSLLACGGFSQFSSAPFSHKVARALLEAGCDPHSKTKDGKLLLNKALEGVGLEHAKLLMEYGARPSREFVETLSGEARELAEKWLLRDELKAELNEDSSHAESRSQSRSVKI